MHETTALRAAKCLVDDLRILAGDTIAVTGRHTNGASWQDVAGTAHCNAVVLAKYLSDARNGGNRDAITLLYDAMRSGMEIPT